MYWWTVDMMSTKLLDARYVVWIGAHKDRRAHKLVHTRTEEHTRDGEENGINVDIYVICYISECVMLTIWLIN